MKQSHSHTKHLIYASFFTAIGVLFPQIFHAFGLGPVFLPMHIPIILAGIVCTSLWGLLSGITCVFLSSLLFGMPGFTPTGYSMFFELAAYGFFSGIFFHAMPRPYTLKRIYPALLLTMLTGRLVAIIAKYVIFHMMGHVFALTAVCTSLFITAWPGILLQWITIPPIILLMQKNKSLIPKENQ